MKLKDELERQEFLRNKNLPIKISKYSTNFQEKIHDAFQKHMWTFDYVENLQEMLKSKMEESISIHFESLEIEKEGVPSNEEPS